MSFGLTTLGGYLLYNMSGHTNEYQLSWFSNHLFTPCIAAVTGCLVGTLSKDHPVLTAVVGLLPWTLSLNLYTGRVTPSALSTMVELEFLTGVAAAVGWRFLQSNRSTTPASTSVDNDG
jgi:hypothetical protein